MFLRWDLLSYFEEELLGRNHDLPTPFSSGPTRNLPITLFWFAFLRDHRLSLRHSDMMDLQIQRYALPSLLPSSYSRHSRHHAVLASCPAFCPPLLGRCRP